MNECQEMDKIFDELFPIMRSITGQGVRDTIQILQQYIPLQMEHIASGKEVFDWTVPKEWVIREAWIKDEKGNKVIDIQDLNLHVVNYSEPVDVWLSLEELRKNIHTLPNLPDAVPYVISYYKERWGFCMSYNQLTSLSDGQYHVYIDSEKIDGELNYAQVILKGKSEKEVLISAYICHPSMANNELSGPIVSTFLYNRIKKWENREYTYRFVFLPETIGSLVFLYQYGEQLQKNLYSGVVLTCLGGKGYPLSYKMSRNKNAPLNEVMSYLVNNEKRENYTLRDFSPLGGSDERQYNSPGFNLPIGQFSKMIYGQYDGYHNSLDTKEAMTIEALKESLDEIEAILKIQELNAYYINLKPYGEPQLGKYGLYPDMNAPTTKNASSNQMLDGRQQLNQILMLLNYSDGHHNLIDIAKKQQYKIEDYECSIAQLISKQILMRGEN